MLPLLPALLLLLLNGPSGLDKLAHEAHLPEAIRALHRQIEEERDPEALKSLKHELVLASLLASGNGELSEALAELFLLVGDAPAAAAAPPDIGSERQPILANLTLANPSDGFFTSARTRDGPLVR